MFRYDLVSIGEDFTTVIPNIVIEEINADLIKAVSYDEVKRAVFGLGRLKSPGPDGFPGIFYHNQWEVIKEDVMQPVTIFFQTGKLPP